MGLELSIVQDITNGSVSSMISLVTGSVVGTVASSFAEENRLDSHKEHSLKIGAQG